jgi:hypothetical protein
LDGVPDLDAVSVLDGDTVLAGVDGGVADAEPVLDGVPDLDAVIVLDGDTVPLGVDGGVPERDSVEGCVAEADAVIDAVGVCVLEKDGTSTIGSCN